MIFSSGKEYLSLVMDGRRISCDRMRLPTGGKGSSHAVDRLTAGPTVDLELVSSASSDFSLQDDEAALATLKELLSSATGQGSSVLVSIPRHQVTTRELTMPSADPTEIGQMVRLQAEELVPYPTSDIILDQIILERTAEGYSRVLVVICHKDVVERILNLLEKLKVDPEQLTLSSVAIYNWYCATPLWSADDTVALVELGTNSMDFVVVCGRELLFTRGVALANEEGQAWNQTEAYGEILESFSAFRRDPEKGRPVARILVAGPVPGLGSFAENVSRALAVPVETVRPFGDGADGDAPCGSLISAGLAVESTGNALARVSLLPQARLQRRAARRIIERAVRRGLCAAVIVLLSIAVGRQALEAKNEYLGFLRAQKSLIEPAARETRAKKQRVEIVKNLLDQKFSAIEIMEAIHRLAPPNLVFREVHYKREGEVNLAGTALTREVAFKFIDDLRKWQWSVPVRVREGVMSSKPDSGQMVTEFEIIVSPEQEQTKTEGTREKKEEGEQRVETTYP